VSIVPLMAGIQMQLLAAVAPRLSDQPLKKQIGMSLRPE